MKYWVTYPMHNSGVSSEFMSSEAISRFTLAAEAAGFDGVAFTDHPAPSEKWLTHGGHDALDPFAVMSYLAAITTTISLIPNIVVLPYRNPFLVAKSSATVDLLSGGRFVLSTAVGYLRSEYRALGVDFDNRSALFEEALEVIKGVWSTDDFKYEGSNFTAMGVTANPKPTHIPIWIGGNSRIARRRVAIYGDCWNPFMTTAETAATTKTAPLESAEDLKQMLDYLWREVDAAGRDRAGIDVAFMAAHGDVASAGFDPDRHLAALDELAGLGVTWASASIPSDSLDRATDALAEYGARVISASRS